MESDDSFELWSGSEFSGFNSNVGDVEHYNNDVSDVSVSSICTSELSEERDIDDLHECDELHEREDDELHDVIVHENVPDETELIINNDHLNLEALDIGDSGDIVLMLLNKDTAENSDLESENLVELTDHADNVDVLEISETGDAGILQAELDDVDDESQVSQDDSQLSQDSQDTYIDEHASDIEVASIHSSNLSSASSDSEPDIEVDNWSDATHNIVIPRFQEHVGPNHNLDHNDSPLCYFYQLWDEDMFSVIKDEVNRYAEYLQRLKERVDRSWEPVTLPEIKAFFGIQIIMGIHKLPSYKCYWSEDPFLGVPAISSIMPKPRYEKISQYLHISDDNNNHNNDKLFKVRPLINMFVDNAKSRYDPGREMAVDEAMIAFKGRLNFKQYMPAKPTKWGIKVWMLADSRNGYVLNLEVYTGKDVHNPNAGVGLGHRVVTQLVEPYYGRSHHVYFDNFFSSPALLEALEDNGTFACSTVRLNRRGLPDRIKKAQPKRGESVTMQKGNMLATVWFDKRKVAVLSTCQNPGADMIQQRRGPNQNVHEISKPRAISNYTKHMGGVDRADQLRSYYNTGREAKKWWKYLLWFVLDICIVNSYILYQETLSGPAEDDEERTSTKLTHLKFRVQLARQLIASYSSKQRRGRKRKATVRNIVVGEDNIAAHSLTKIEGRKRVCVQCSANNRKTSAGRGIESSFMCSLCGVALCQKRGCFAEFHSEHLL